jgi:hypothetical protein
MKRRVLALAVLLSCVLLVAAAVLDRGFLANAVKVLSAASGSVDSDPDAFSQELDRHLHNTAAHRELLRGLGADLIARQRPLPEAAELLTDFARQDKPEWLHAVGRLYPGRPEQASVAASLVYYTLFLLRAGDPGDEATARRLVRDYRACYGIPLTPPKTAPRPPCWPAASAGLPETP